MDVQATITYGDFDAPAGTVVDQVIVMLIGNNPANSQSQAVAPDTPSVTFNNVAADTYTGSAQAISSGVAIGPSVTDTITVSGPSTVTVSIPQSISLAQTQPVKVPNAMSLKSDQKKK